MLNAKTDLVEADESHITNLISNLLITALNTLKKKSRCN